MQKERINFGAYSRDDVYRALLKGFTEGKKWDMGALTERELARAKELAETKYSTEQWNFMR